MSHRTRTIESSCRSLLGFRAGEFDQPRVLVDFAPEKSRKLSGPDKRSIARCLVKILLLRCLSEPYIVPNRLTPTASRERGDARAGNPRCVSILTITAGSSIAAMIFKSPPHCRQCSRSIPKARLSRRAQPILLFSTRSLVQAPRLAIQIASLILRNRKAQYPRVLHLCHPVITAISTVD